MNKTEERIKADTGGEKCSKLAQMADAPTQAILELLEHYGKGRAKYPGDAAGPNYTKGYPWSLSYNAAIRHLLQFWGGEDIDEETGSKHVIAAAWHCLCLALFMDRHRIKDDRWEKPKLPCNNETRTRILTPLTHSAMRCMTSEDLKQYIHDHEEEFMN